ncbi:MAG TPA: MotA/TolQ/ExbB proton channel family protein [Pseudomonadales bacterium]|nr:MotA/TolQ/ExbB proton channel family protein [Pseudomonadales bacterium]
MDLFASIVLFFQHGGVFMIPIATVMAIGVAIALERYFYLARQTSANRRDYEKLLPLLRQQRLREVQDMTAKSKSAVCKIVADGIARLSHTRRRQDIEYAMEEQLLEVLPHIERRTPYLATFANVSTLLGLLGTVIGLISAFTAVAQADPAEKAALLSQSISVSMNCTAFGLMVAIPLLLLHSMLQSKTSAIVESLEIALVKFLNLLEERPERAAAKAAAPAPAMAKA